VATPNQDVAARLAAMWTETTTAEVGSKNDD
jgi:hypothetical protein